MRHGLDLESQSTTKLGKGRVRVVHFAPDGEEDFDGEKAQAARYQRRDRRTRGPNGVLDLTTSKTSTAAVFDVTAYPLFQTALTAVPATQRVGPLVVDEGGVPMRRRYYQDLYREVPDAAKVPAEVWNMRARHGGATEARESGVDLADIAEHAQHSDINTTRKHYIVPSVETSRRVAKARVAHRNKA
jgi:hypothetical protein